MKTQLIATKAFSYGGRRHQAGAELAAKPRDARILVAIGKASYGTRVMTADVDVVSAGQRWDPELHVETKLKNKDGTWRKRPGAASAAPPSPPVPPPAAAPAPAADVAPGPKTPARKTAKRAE